MSTNQYEVAEKIISANLARITDMLKFAETKNAAMVTFCGGWILASLNILSSKSESIPLGYSFPLTLSIPLLALAGIISVSTFLPRVIASSVPKEGRFAPNYLFFEDISSNNRSDCASNIIKRYLNDGGGSLNLHAVNDLADQMWVISRITSSKFKRFDISARIVMLAIASMLAPIVNIVFKFHI